MNTDLSWARLGSSHGLTWTEVTGVGLFIISMVTGDWGLVSRHWANIIPLTLGQCSGCMTPSNPLIPSSSVFCVVYVATHQVSSFLFSLNCRGGIFNIYCIDVDIYSPELPILLHVYKWLNDCMYLCQPKPSKVLGGLRPGFWLDNEICSKYQVF